MDEDRVAAMSAALLSLGEKAAQGLGRGDLSQVYVEGETGTVFLVSCDDEAVLVAVAAAGAKAGLMLFEVRRAAAAIARRAARRAAAPSPRSPVTIDRRPPLADAEAAYAAHKARPRPRPSAQERRSRHRAPARALAAVARAEVAWRSSPPLEPARDSPLLVPVGSARHGVPRG